ncbi:S9 family peptidase [Silanimonas sp.]|uniref:S9 family peptidase n=1 Tax=Silanimonas sp. TaxID=1929290 RepID=UPI0022BE2E30|nr:S9 family peptidase [Silanimonas sp.]MCZ8115193.1 S9 family peptidase [Silanimonas sp.]
MNRPNLSRRPLAAIGLLLASGFAAPASFAADAPTPPVAAQRPHEVKAPHGAVRNDEYYWLRDDKRENPEMLAYLNAENAYADAMLAPLAPLKQRLYDEIVGRIQQDDSSVPYFEDGYWYYTRFETGKDYAITARRKGTMEAPEEILLDQNAMAEGKDYFQVGGWEVSPDGSKLAWAEDLNGRRQYTIKVKDIATGELLDSAVTGTSGNIVWGDDNQTIWYVENDPETLLSTHVKTHVIGTPSSEDKLVYTETDNSFYMGIGRTRSKQYICIGVSSTVSSEQRCTKAASPGEFTVVAPRERDVEYSADHYAGRWVITTNWNAPNFRIMTAAEDALGSRENWKEFVPHAGDVFIEGVELFDGYMAIGERSDGLRRIRILKDGGESQFVKSDEPAYTMGLSVNAMPDTPWVRYTYTSLTTPATTYEINVETGERKQLKQDPVPGFDPTQYTTERAWVPSRDGTVRIPVSIVYRKGFEKNGEAALLQYAYGSYGSSMDPGFSRLVPSLLDRGMVYAIAHIRGGQEMGRAWYDGGKLFNKINTFTDFIDVTDWLVANGYAAEDRVAAMGGSAGGLLMGAVANMAPEKYDAIISQVPFVDVVTTMLDPSIPLTTNEYDEWGNPEKKEFYDYMLSYSPYDQLAAKDYPAMFVGTGLWDSQVQYFEPAKYVARLRAKKTDDNLLVFRTNMEAGHGGKSGRFRRFAEAAEQYAFMLDQLGVEKRAE